MSENKLTSFPVVALALATLGTAFATTTFAFTGSIAHQTLLGWFVLFIGANMFASATHPGDSDGIKWVLARWLGYGGLVGYCALASCLEFPLTINFAMLLIWKWADIGFSYKVVDAG